MQNSDNFVTILLTKGGEGMDVSTITSIVQSIGFPIVCCGAMGWYVKYITDKHRESEEKLNEQHKEEMKEVTAAIENNTVAITKLCEMMGGDGVEIKK